MNVTQIYAIITLLLAFNVPQDKVQYIQTLLEQAQSTPSTQSTPLTQSTTMTTQQSSAAAPVVPICTVSFNPLITINVNGVNTPTNTTILPVDKNAYFDVSITNCDKDTTYTWSDEKQELWSGNIVSDMSSYLPVPDKGLYYKPTAGSHTLTFSVVSGTSTISTSVGITTQ